MDKLLQDVLLLNTNAMICTDGGQTMRHPRGYGSYAKMIREYVTNRKLIKLERSN